MMARLPHAIERSAQALIDAIRVLIAHRIATSVTGLTLTLIAASTYIAVGSLNFNPTRSTIGIRILLHDSGGLLPNQDVTLRGVAIGRVTSVLFTPTGVEAKASIKSDVRVPRDSTVSVSALSPAGEQYLDFRPRHNGGPALTDGSVVDEERTQIPVSFAQLLADANGMLAQVDPKKLAVMTDELRVGSQGPAKLAALLDGGAFLISTVDSVLPQTMSVLRTSRTVLTTLKDAMPGLGSTSQRLHSILGAANRMDGGFRRLVDHGGDPLGAIDGVVDENSATMIQLLGNLTSVAQLMTTRVPALNEMLNSTRGGSTLEALASTVHDGHFWAVVDIYPRYGCDYDLPRLPPSVPNYPEPYRYTYCKNPDPSVLVRGARNAPRPPGDDTAGPPPGADPLAQTDPSPPVKSSIPTPFGGVAFPVPLPADPPGWPAPPGWPGPTPPGWTGSDAFSSPHREQRFP